MDGLLPIA